LLSDVAWAQPAIWRYQCEREIKGQDVMICTVLLLKYAVLLNTYAALQCMQTKQFELNCELPNILPRFPVKSMPVKTQLLRATPCCCCMWRVCEQILVLSLRLHFTKDSTIVNTAAATVRQLVSSVFERVTAEDLTPVPGRSCLV